MGWPGGSSAPRGVGGSGEMSGREKVASPTWLAVGPGSVYEGAFPVAKAEEASIS